MLHRLHLLLIALTLAAGASTVAGILGWSDGAGFLFGWLLLVVVLTWRRLAPALPTAFVSPGWALGWSGAAHWLRQIVIRRFPRFAAALPQVIQHGS